MRASPKRQAKARVPALVGHALACRRPLAGAFFLTFSRSLLLLALGTAGVYAQNSPQLDCNQPVDVLLTAASPRANVRFQATAGETVYIRLLANTPPDPGFGLNPVVVLDPFGNFYNPRPQNQTLAQAIAQPVAGATPIDLAGGLPGETFTGLEFDL